MTQRFGILSPEIWGWKDDLAPLFDGQAARLRPALSTLPGWRPDCDVVLGWRDRRGDPARRLAGRAALPFRAVEIGPLRSVKPAGEPPMSFRIGPETAGPVQPAEDDGAADRAANGGLATLRRLRLAWRNDALDRLPGGLGRERFVLVVVGDGLAPTGQTEARHLVRLARETDPGSPIAILAEAGVPARLADDVASRHPGTVPVIGANPWALFDAAHRIYAGPDGETGRLARLAGREVLPQEGAPSSPARLFRETFLDEVVYLDAWSRTRIPFETAAEQLAWLRDRYLENGRPSSCVGISRWKAARVARFLDGPAGPARFHGSAAGAIREAASSGGRVVAWETRMPGRLAEDCGRAGVPLVRMEDGFLRSVGLGAAFLPGASAVLDGRGIYYDPRQESDLEHILATAPFPPELVARAAALRCDIVALRLSKYNVGRAPGRDDPLAVPPGREIVLVPGQVEDDASILLGSRQVAGNLALVAAARRRNPDSFLIFKPHPDVAAGLRRGAVEPADALAHADAIVTEAGIAELLERVDAVETMTSLAGFEALLRGKRVAAHGQPFYAGWGLTADLDPLPRRTRRLTLDELVAAALILYPRYLDPVTGLRCAPEVLVRRLAAARDAAREASPRQQAARMAYVRARHALLTPLGAALRRLKDAARAGGARPDGPA